MPFVRQTERSFTKMIPQAVGCTENPSEGVLILDSRHLTTDSRIALSDIQPPWIGWVIHWQSTLVQKTVGQRFLNGAI